ncbi:MAG: hypothetical protein PHE54_04520, partial [Bacilli bacterium]|nr:hypothetical protein [Bacilli bacterium]
MKDNLLLAKKLFIQGNYKESKKIFRDKLKKVTNKRERAIILYYLAQISIEENNLEKAEYFCKKIINLDEKNSLSFAILGRLAFLKNDFEMALNYLELGAFYDPSDLSSIHYDLAKLYLHVKQISKAQYEFKYHISHNINPNPDSYIILIKSLFYSNSYSEALDYINMALKKGYYNAIFDYIIGVIYYYDNKKEESLPYLKKYLNSNSKNHINCKKAFAHYLLGNVQEAHNFYHQLIDYNMYNQRLAQSHINKHRHYLSDKDIHSVFNFEPNIEKLKEILLTEEKKIIGIEDKWGHFIYYPNCGYTFDENGKKIDENYLL